MVTFTFAFTIAFLLLAVVLGTNTEASMMLRSSRRLSYEAIAGYEPGSMVTDHNALDLDQAALEAQLALSTSDSFNTAKAIYTQGAFSKSVALVTLATPLNNPLTEKTEVTGKTTSGAQVTGVIFEDTIAGTQEIKIQYDTTTIQASYVGCQVGANPEPNVVGCFNATGEIIIGGRSHGYSYNVLQDNMNERTIQGFSTEAEEKMYRCENCPYVTYEKFYEYYGEFDYANQWILAAFDSGSTNFVRGNADFGAYSEEGRSEAIKKGSAFMSIWMYVIREMEDAIDDCKSGCDLATNCNDDPVHAWDEAFAFYSGSLEGRDGSGSGVLLHALADKRCMNFKTCGDLANDVSGISHVNIDVLANFVDGKQKLRTGQCGTVRENKERIEQLMAVPLIQGTLRYAYITDYEEAVPTEKSKAEGATFAAAVLPLVHSCNEDAADVIYKNMRAGQDGPADFPAVKRAFESVYACMKVRCEDVGGLYDPATGGYLKLASPCGVVKEEKKKAGLIAGISTVGTIAFCVIAFFAYRMVFGTHSSTQAMHDLNSGEKIVA